MSDEVYLGIMSGLHQALAHARGELELPSKTFEHTFPDCPTCANMMRGDCKYKDECMVELDTNEFCRIGTPSCFSDTKKFAYCPICDKEMFFISKDIVARCPVCNHHLNLHDREEDMYG